MFESGTSATKVKTLHIKNFDFNLPNELIATRPVYPRDSAKLLVTRPNQNPKFLDSKVSLLSSFLRRGDTLVLNDTKVIPAALIGNRIRNGGSAQISFTLHKRESLNSWVTFARPAKRLKHNDVIDFKSSSGQVSAVVEDKNGGEVKLRFDVSGERLDHIIHEIGHIPLPPYIAKTRVDDEKDRIDYQTIYAKHNGAVAAPTAGLHFTDQLMHNLENVGIKLLYLTLHVGAGTFLPVKVDNTKDHHMHAEWGNISKRAADTINETKANGGRIVAVGTTSLRLLESATNENSITKEFNGETSIFITPGYKFKAVDMLLTNFHLPKSTLFMLVSAFCGLDTIKEAYQYAINNRYRFYSYGDCSLLFPKHAPL